MMVCVFFFFFNDTATTEIYTYGHTRSLHDALPISEQGTGIGLVVCKRLIEWMGGAIGVESTPGTGSVFWVDLLRTAQVQPGVGSAQAEPAMAVASHVRSEERRVGKAWVSTCSSRRSPYQSTKNKKQYSTTNQNTTK